MNKDNQLLVIGAISGLAMSAHDALKRAADMAAVARSRGFDEIPRIGIALEEASDLCRELKKRAEVA